MPTPPLSHRTRNIVSWVAQILAAAILGMASITKLTGNADAIALFTTLGAEPWGRWLVGLAELTAVVLLLRPRTAVLGGGMGIILMVGAIGAHLTRLGVLYQGDPSLFIMALMVLAASVTVVGLRRAAARA